MLKEMTSAAAAADRRRRSEQVVMLRVFIDDFRCFVLFVEQRAEPIFFGFAL